MHNEYRMSFNNYVYLFIFIQFLGILNESIIVFFVLIFKSIGIL